MRQPFVRSRILSVSQLEDIQKNPDRASQLGRPVPDGHHALHYPNGAVIGLATTQPKKFKEMIEPLRTRVENVKIINPVEWLGWWLSADEVSRTYVGNAYEKAQSIVDRIYNHIGYDNFIAEMKRRGLNPENFAFIVNDTGSSMSTNYSAAPEFDRSRLEVSPFGDWPGVETGPILDAQGGVAAFHSSLKKMKARLKKEGREDEYSDKGKDEVTYLLFKPTPNPHQIEFICYEAEVPLKYHTSPGRHSGEVLTSHDFLSLDMPGLPDHVRAKRIAEFRDDYFRTYSPMALVMHKMVEDMNVPNKLAPSFERAAKPAPKMTLATQANLIPVQNGVHKPPMENDVLYQVTNYNHTKNGAIDNMCRYSEGVMLTPHHEDIVGHWDENFLDLMDIWCSLIVSKQVCVEQFYGKPLVVLNDKKNFTHMEAFNGELDWDDPHVERAFVDYIGKIDPKQDPWLQFVMLTRYLHEKNFVKQEPDYLFTQISADDATLSARVHKMLDEGRSERVPTPNYRAEYFGRDRTDLFEVSVLGSAGTRVAEYTNDATDLGYSMAAQGIHVRTGGGNYGIMGAVARGVLDYMQETSNRISHCHLSLIQMPRTLQFEGAAVDPKDIKTEFAERKDRANKFMAVEKDFDERMNSIFRSNLSVVMAPGIGTYQEAVRWLRQKRDGAPHLENQKLIVLNATQPGLEDGIRLMDPFLRILPKHILENDIQVVHSVGAVMDLVSEKHGAYLLERQMRAPSAQSAQVLQLKR